tara:strand:+ start:112 stop:345 length:234 start_codon:yes stop_codon:yes gene_type:complete
LWLVYISGLHQGSLASLAYSPAHAVQTNQEEEEEESRETKETVVVNHLANHKGYQAGQGAEERKIEAVLPISTRTIE